MKKTSIFISFTLISVSFISIIPLSSAETVEYNFQSPYEDLDFDNISHKSSTLHFHTGYSDGVEMPHEMIDYYDKGGRDIMAITDHSEYHQHSFNNSYPWTDFSRFDYPSYHIEIDTENDTLYSYGGHNHIDESVHWGDRYENTTGEIIAYDMENEEELWRVGNETLDTGVANKFIDLDTQNETIYVENNNTVQAISTQTQEEIWNSGPLDDSGIGSPSLKRVGDKIFVSNQDRYVNILDVDTGEVIARTPSTGFRIMLYFGDGIQVNEEEGTFYVLGTDGEFQEYYISNASLIREGQITGEEIPVRGADFVGDGSLYIAGWQDFYKVSISNVSDVEWSKHKFEIEDDLDMRLPDHFYSIYTFENIKGTIYTACHGIGMLSLNATDGSAINMTYEEGCNPTGLLFENDMLYKNDILGRVVVYDPDTFEISDIIIPGHQSGEDRDPVEMDAVAVPGVEMTLTENIKHANSYFTPNFTLGYDDQPYTLQDVTKESQKRNGLVVGHYHSSDGVSDASDVKWSYLDEYIDTREKYGDTLVGREVFNKDNNDCRLFWDELNHELGRDDNMWGFFGDDQHGMDKNFDAGFLQYEVFMMEDWTPGSNRTEVKQAMKNGHFYGWQNENWESDTDEPAVNLTDVINHDGNSIELKFDGEVEEIRWKSRVGEREGNTTVHTGKDISIYDIDTSNLRFVRAEIEVPSGSAGGTIFTQPFSIIADAVEDDDPDDGTDDDTDDSTDDGGSSLVSDTDDEKTVSVVDLGMVALFILILFSFIYFVTNSGGRIKR